MTKFQPAGTAWNRKKAALSRPRSEDRLKLERLKLLPGFTAQTVTDSVSAPEAAGKDSLNGLLILKHGCIRTFESGKQSGNSHSPSIYAYFIAAAAEAEHCPA